jgi:predicted HAD superfamily Cof-like phosphohydrolase
MDSEEMRQAYSSGDGSFHIESNGSVRVGQLTWAGPGAKRNSYEMVMEFHEALGHPVADSPTLIHENRKDLRIALIKEELEELIAAVEDNDLVAIADALGDLEYVVNGAALEYGINLPGVVREIHRSNMTKLGPEGKPIYREDGKILKGEGYEPPDIEAVLGL